MSSQTIRMWNIFFLFLTVLGTYRSAVIPVTDREDSREETVVAADERNNATEAYVEDVRLSSSVEVRTFI